jgi:hypothetical protein
MRAGSNAVAFRPRRLTGDSRSRCSAAAAPEQGVAFLEEKRRAAHAVKAAYSRSGIPPAAAPEQRVAFLEEKTPGGACNDGGVPAQWHSACGG